ncbi:MAG: gamma-glutamyltransferase [Chromatiales bacterium 21-64-14]|nr:MAG: gamma-glutamyltransferase [Chromatiales bacterium 21-64-14]HQU15800.1 gamma-glutamyltransferase [Gammaproteobacteria bacterium]
MLRSLLTALTVVLALGTPLARAGPPQPVRAQHGMVVTAQHLASEVGVDILRAGGNAVDAAVAVGYALAVVHPCCGNLGGGGFMLIHRADGGDVFINFREKAPAAARRDLFLDRNGNVIPGLSTGTYLSVGVPGTVLGLDTALRRYGTMTRAQVMAPAIRLARAGFVLQAGDVQLLNQRAADFARQPNVASIFLKAGKPYRAGERLVQPQLAHTLEQIEKLGPDAFYRGAIAAAVVAASRRNGGLLSRADFAHYTVEEEHPVGCTYRGYQILSAPPPSSGGTTLCEILNVVAGYPMAKLGFHSARSIHYLVEAMRRAYADRNTYLGDPDFVTNPIARLLAPAYAAQLRKGIRAFHATPSAQVHGGLGPPEGDDTTHYSIVDAHGNAVAVTYTLNYFFGSGLIAGNTGFFLNNEMDDFTSKPGVPNSYGLVQGPRNAVAPGKRPLSSMSPTIVLHNGRLFMVTGSPGGSRIITITLETILNVIDYGMNIEAAVAAPRIHQQWLPDVVYAEPDAISPPVLKALEQMGYSVVVQPPWGAAEAILVDPHNGLREGANDPRRPAGLAVGY